MKTFIFLTALITAAKAYWLMGVEDFITTERLDPVVNPGKISGHVHSVLGGSNFRMTTNTASLRESECTSIPIPQDKSNYWFPHLYFQWSNGSFTSLDGGAVIYYLFNDKPGTTIAFPDDFRMLSGDPTLRTYDPNSFAQQAVTFLCLDFSGTSTRYNFLPPTACPSGVRAQINFPSCWDGKNLDSVDHKSHVAFLSGGPDSGTCSDPKYPITLPRIFIEVYWASNDFEQHRSQAMNTTQPFVYSYGDRTGYGYHADFINGWDQGVLQKAVDNCHCNPYGDPTCCVQQGLFGMNQGKSCRITKSINETTTGTLPKLPGNNPVQNEGVKATPLVDTAPPATISPVFAYTGDSPTSTGKVVTGPQTASPLPSSSAAPPSKSAASINPTPAASSTVAAQPTSAIPNSGVPMSTLSPSVSGTTPHATGTPSTPVSSPHSTAGAPAGGAGDPHSNVASASSGSMSTFVASSATAHATVSSQPTSTTSPQMTGILNPPAASPSNDIDGTTNPPHSNTPTSGILAPSPSASSIISQLPGDSTSPVIPSSDKPLSILLPSISGTIPQVTSILNTPVASPHPTENVPGGDSGSTNAAPTCSGEISTTMAGPTTAHTAVPSQATTPMASQTINILNPPAAPPSGGSGGAADSNTPELSILAPSPSASSVIIISQSPGGKKCRQRNPGQQTTNKRATKRRSARHARPFHASRNH